MNLLLYILPTNGLLGYFDFDFCLTPILLNLCCYLKSIHDLNTSKKLD